MSITVYVEPTFHWVIFLTYVAGALFVALFTWVFSEVLMRKDGDELKKDLRWTNRLIMLWAFVMIVLIGLSQAWS